MTATVNAAITALIAAFTSVTPAGWQVIDSGPPVDPQKSFLCIGYDHSGAAAINVTCGESHARAMRDRESYDISNLLSLWQGSEDTDAAAVRAELLTAFNTFRDAIRADRTLGHVVTDAVVTDYDIDQDVSPLGDVANLRFTVHIDAF